MTNVKAESGLFADKAQSYKNEVSTAYQKSNARDPYNTKVDDLADAAKSGVNKAEKALKTKQVF